MKHNNFDKSIDKLKQDNLWLKKIIVISIIANLLLAFMLLCKFRDEKIIIAPSSNPENSYWLKNDTVSTEYMEALTRDLLCLSLNVSPETVKKQYDSFLKFVTPNLRSYIIENLKKSADSIVTNDISQAFYIDQMKAIPATQTIYVSGYLKTYVNNQQLANVQQLYKIQFKSDNLTIKVEQYRLLEPQQDVAEIKRVGL